MGRSPVPPTLIPRNKATNFTRSPPGIRNSCLVRGVESLFHQDGAAVFGNTGEDAAAFEFVLGIRDRRAVDKSELAENVLRCPARAFSNRSPVAFASAIFDARGHHSLADAVALGRFGDA